MCGCEKFYIKDPDDEYETFEFCIEAGGPVFSDDIDESEYPEVSAETRTYCNQCAWNGKLSELDGQGK
jgi:hypothetical protein